MVAKASQSFPQSRFVVGDFCTLPAESSSSAGIPAFYCFVHLTPAQLQSAFAEMFRVLSGGGVMLLAFHAGSEVARAENFSVPMRCSTSRSSSRSTSRQPWRRRDSNSIDLRVRDRYSTEHPGKRCYIFAHKPRAGDHVTA